MDKKDYLVKFINCGLEFTIPIVISIMIGIWLDKKFNIFPLCLVIFLILGCISGCFNMKRYIDKN